MRHFNLHFMGRLGNCMFQYAFARAYCQRHGLQLHTDEWVGERLFNISHPRCEGDLPRRDENTLMDGERDISYRSYSQQQKCIDYYTRTQCKEWFQLRPEVDERLMHYPVSPIVAHYRADDYAPLGYVVVSKESYIKAAKDAGYDPLDVRFIEQGSPCVDPYFAGWADFAPDFLRLRAADVIFRANSSFSWWAANLSYARVFSPVIDGLTGGHEHLCSFVEGNHPRFANLDFVTDLHILP